MDWQSLSGNPFLLFIFSVATIIAYVVTRIVGNQAKQDNKDRDTVNEWADLSKAHTEELERLREWRLEDQRVHANEIMQLRAERLQDQKECDSQLRILRRQVDALEARLT